MPDKNRRTQAVSGRRLHALRIERRFTREALAHRSGVAKRVIDAIESGVHPCFQRTLDALARTLDVPPEALIHRTRLEVGTVPPLGDLVGRERELAVIDAAWRDNISTCLVVTAPAGSGKSTLLSHWLARLGERDYDGAEMVFWWSLGTDEAGGSAMCDQLIERALVFFGDDAPTHGTSLERAARLAHLVAAKRTILIIDELESVSSPFHGGVTYAPLRILLTQLAASLDGLCAVIARPPLLSPFGEGAGRPDGRTVIALDLPPLRPEQGAALLERLGVRGHHDELAAAAVEYQGNPLALRLLGTYLVEALNGDVTRRDSVRLLDVRFSVIMPSTVIASYVRYYGEHHGLLRDIIRLASLSDLAIPHQLLEHFRRCEAVPGISEHLVHVDSDAIAAALRVLERAGLLQPIGPDRLGMHPIVRAAVREQILSTEPRAVARAHEIFSAYFEQQVDGLPTHSDECRALHAAARHRCLAGHHLTAWREIYYPRLQRGDLLYSILSEGMHNDDVATLRHFYRVPWRECEDGLPLPVGLMVMYLSGLALQALSRLGDAVVAFESARGVALAIGDYHYAGMLSGHVIHVVGLCGELRAAEREIDRALDICEKSGLRRLTRMIRFKAGHTLWEMGQTARADLLFAEGLAIAADEEPPEEIAFLRLLDGMSWYFLFEYLCDRGDSATAREVALRIESMCAALDLEFARGLISLTRAMLRGPGALAEAERAVTAFRSDRFRELLCGALLIRADLILQAGDRPDAERDAREAHELAAASGLPLRRCDALALLAKVLGLDTAEMADLRAAVAHTRRSCSYHLRRLACSD